MKPIKNWKAWAASFLIFLLLAPLGLRLLIPTKPVLSFNDKEIRALIPKGTPSAKVLQSIGSPYHYFLLDDLEFVPRSEADADAWTYYCMSSNGKGPIRFTVIFKDSKVDSIMSECK